MSARRCRLKNVCNFRCTLGNGRTSPTLRSSSSIANAAGSCRANVNSACCISIADRFGWRGRTEESFEAFMVIDSKGLFGLAGELPLTWITRAENSQEFAGGLALHFHFRVAEHCAQRADRFRRGGRVALGDRLR